MNYCLLNYCFLMFVELPLIYQIMMHVIMLFLLDHVSKFTWLYPISCKFDVFSIFFRNFSLISNPSLIVRSNPSNRFAWQILEITPHFYVSSNLPFEYVSPHPSSNGFVERKHHHLVEIDLPLLTHSSAPLTRLWLSKQSIAS